MEKFSVALLCTAVLRIGFTATSIAAWKESYREQNPNIAQEFENDVASVLLKDFKLSAMLRGQISRAATCLASPDCSEIEALTLLRELSNNLIEELTQSQFLRIAADKRILFKQSQPLFGVEVQNRFPDANIDISSASRCFALDEWTACVFHLMRVLEIGLRDLAKQIGLNSESMELENWKNVIDQVEKQIRLLEQTPKSPQKSANLQFYSEAASCFRHFKDAWRNHVSHSRANYSEREALAIYNNVMIFMHTLAKH